MSEEGSQVQKKKSFIERMTGTAAQFAALIVALSALFTQIPGFTRTISDAYCSIFSCSEAQEPPPQADHLEERPADDRVSALQAAGIDSEGADPDWFRNEYTPYPFIADALLTLLQGKRLSQPVDIGAVVGNYEQGGDSPRRTADVDIPRLKAAVVGAHKDRYGETVATFKDLTQ